MCAVILTANGQSGWEELYRDADITVKLSYDLNTTSCDQQWPVLNTYKYKISGQLKPYTQYVNWKMAYLSCDGKIYYLQHSINIGQGGATDQMVESMDWQFEGKRIVNPHFDIVTASYKDENNNPRTPTPGMPLSQLEVNVSKDRKLCSGSSATLSATVKKSLGSVRYEWMQSADGKSWSTVLNGTGSSYTTPVLYRTMNYHCIVTDVGGNAYPIVSNTVTITITDPAISITGENEVCKGGHVFLNADVSDEDKGGSYQWQSSITGNSYLDVNGSTYATFSSPEINGAVNYRCIYIPANKKCAVAVSPAINIKIIQPAPITVSDNKVVCSGNTATLSATVPGNRNNGTFLWQSSTDKSIWADQPYSNNSAFQTQQLYQNTYFRAAYTLANSGCGKVNSNEVKISVIQNAVINVSGKIRVKAGKATKLTATSDRSNGSFQWQKSDVGYYWEDIYNGTSSKLATEKLMQNTYYRCIYKTSGVNCEAYSPKILVSVKQPLWNNAFSSDDKFMHVSVGLGLDLSYRPLMAERTTATNYGSQTLYNTDVRLINPAAIGVQGSFVFHPYIKDFLSVGFKIGGGIGTAPLNIIGGKVNTGEGITQTRYFTYKADAGVELAAGYKAIKALVAFQNSLQFHMYSQMVTDAYSQTTDIADMEIRRETLMAGIRVGRYNGQRRSGKAYRHPFCFDFYFIFAWDRQFSWSPFVWSYKNQLPKSTGLGMAVWIQSVLHLQMDVFPGDSKAATNGTNPNTIMQLSLTYNADWFRGKK